jgi:hypothetical protein
LRQVTVIGSESETGSVFFTKVSNARMSCQD